MDCSERNCPHPALFECEGCGEERCAKHSKLCEICGRIYCHTIESLCYSAHECPQPVETPKTFTERILERVN
jgi:hypothetical protein